MTSLRSRVAAAVVGERRLPVGTVARERRLIRRAIGADVRAVLVIGPGLAARQALRAAVVDVVGLSPHAAEVTICSAALEAGSLPVRQWEAVIVSHVDIGPRLEALRASCPAGTPVVMVTTACRTGGQTVVPAEMNAQRLDTAGRIWLGTVPS